MKIVSVREAKLKGVLLIQFERFSDQRGYFTEPYRESDLRKIVPSFELAQMNESVSKKGTIRGLHFQWNPYMGKLVRTLYGRMLDLILDIRVGSPTFGKLLAIDMPAAELEQSHDQWVWVPPGFAHGNLFTEDTRIEYLCTGEYAASCERGISPLAADIDWSLTDEALHREFLAAVSGTHVITEIAVCPSS